MSRKASWPPKITHHKASGRDRIRVRGIDYYLGPHDSPESRREYARLVLELSGAADPGKADPAPPAVVTVAAVAAAWEIHAKKKFGPDNQEVGQYRGSLDVALELYADLPAADFDVDCLESVREKMTAGAPDGRGWCRTNTNRRVTRIRTVWRWAERKKLVPKGSWEHLRTLEALPPLARGVRESEPRRPCSAEDYEAVAVRLRDPAAAIVRLCWWTGSRPGEFRQLQAGEVDRSGEDWVCRPAKHKNAWRGHAKAIVLGPEARKILEPLLVGKADDAYVFTVRGSTTPYSRQALWSIVNRAARRAGVRFHVYQTRHAMKRRVTREFGLDTARAVLGQKSILTTDHYDGQADEDLARKAARKLG